MPTLTTPILGTFCWPELATTDLAAARAFYSALFGWTTNDMTLDDGTYTFCQLGGRDAAAMHPMSAERYPAGTPAHWLEYVAVASADETAKRVTAAGGTLLAEPFDVTDAGRMAYCADSLGATFCVWEAKRHIGAGVVGEPGSIGWLQLNATDTAQADAFYRAVFGWSSRRDAMPQGGDYVTFEQDGAPVAGVMPLPIEAGAPSHWLLYFAAADVDAAHAKAMSLGARTWVAPTDIPGAGRMAVLADPQGATFALVKFTT